MSARAAAAILLVAAVGCQAIAGLGDFTPDDGGGAGGPGEGGAGGAASAGGGGLGPTTTTGGGAAATTVGTASTSTGGPGCTTGHLVISEVRTRGPDGGNDDYVEILNPTTTAVVLDDAFRIEVRGEEADVYGERWRGDGSLSIGPGQRALLVNAQGGHPGGVVPDDTYETGITDGASVVLYQGEDVVDAICFLCSSSSLAPDFVCEGAPLERADGCRTSSDRSVQRRASGGVDGCADTDDNAADLEDRAPATPTGLPG